MMADLLIMALIVMLSSTVVVLVGLLFNAIGERDRLRIVVNAFEDALDPNTTRAAYINRVEFKTSWQDGEDGFVMTFNVPWIATKDTMRMIRQRAEALCQEDTQ